MQIKGLIWQGNGNGSPSIDLVAKYERNTGVLRLQLSMEGIVHEISVDRTVVCKTKGLFEKCTRMFGQPDMWNGGVDKSEDTFIKQRLVLYV